MIKDPYKLIKLIFNDNNIIGYRIFCTTLCIYTMYFHWGERPDFKSDIMYALGLLGMYIFLLYVPKISIILINQIEEQDRRIEELEKQLERRD